MRLFGNPLPLTLARARAESLRPGIDVARVHHYLWCLYQQYVEDMVLAPADPDVVLMANAVTEALLLGFRKVPKGSGVKAYLSEPVEYGWDVKRRLIWLGTESYLFRVAYHNYRVDQDTSTHQQFIGVTDDFVCQECTEWSGMGVVDVLAGVLDISESDRRDLRSWCERHLAPYRILTTDLDVMRVFNIISEQEYAVRMNVHRSIFTKDSVVIGSLVPWRGEWYWSGHQEQYEDPTDEVVQTIIDSFLRQLPGVVSRYSEGYASKVREQSQKQYERHLARGEDDLVVFPDGPSFAAAQEEWVLQPFRELREEEQQDMRGRHGLPEGGPTVSIPDYLRLSEHEIGVFFSVEEHVEVMDYFDDIRRGLQSPARPLPDEQAEAIREFVLAPAISPAFVRRAAELYGAESIKSAFLVDTCNEDYWLEYLLRRHKGQYFKKRYPPIAVV